MEDCGRLLNKKRKMELLSEANPTKQEVKAVLNLFITRFIY